MRDHVNILVSGEDGEIAEAAAEMLRQGGHGSTVTTDALAALGEARSGAYDVVISVLGEDPKNGMAVLRAAHRGNSHCQVVVVAQHGSAAQAVAAMREGALYYLQAPLKPVELNAIIDRAAERVILERDRDELHSQLAERYGFDGIVGRSRQMQKVFRKVAQIARTRATVLIHGETGTGKELVARAIHYNSTRRNNRFVPLNCAGLVETILESELFGHEKGAFTGATSSRVGLFEYANNGTLFLDEIGDMPIGSQTKLLRVLEHGALVRVGSNEPIHVDVRVVAATHHRLAELIAEGRFRQDLFYRLNVFSITLPPLREHQGDIPLLIERFVREFNEAYDRTVQGMSPAARKILFRYTWPGNVRELRNCIEHMIVATTDEILGEDDLPDYMLEQMGALLEQPALASMAGQPLEEVERQHIARTLELVSGNREKAAELLGIGERTLYRKIQKYGLR